MLLTRYSRHLMLDGIGFEGQEKLMAARVLIVGAGGLGSTAALYLASAGIGELLLCDDDSVDLTNLQRQILHDTENVGVAKTESAQQRLRALNPHCRVSPLTTRLDETTVDEAVATVDLVVDCSDNFATRHLINRACVRHRRTLIFAAALGFDGQASVFNPTDEQSPCYNCLFSEADKGPDISCALMGVFAPLAGMIGCLQAMEAIKVIASPDSVTLIGRLLMIDGRNMRWREIQIRPDPHCTVCRAR